MKTLKELSELKEESDPTGQGRRQRGRDFETTLNGMLKSEGMDPRTNFRPEGEEIDGSFLLGERYYLLEAKWHKNPMPASSLYAFKGKVDGKMVGTLGVFFSMSGYSTEAIDALISGKTPNLILFEGNDLLLIEEGLITMKDAMRAKLRHCAEFGQPLLPLEAYLATGKYRQRRFADAVMTARGSSSMKAKTETAFSTSPHSVTVTTVETEDYNAKNDQPWIFIVQSESDAAAIKELLQRYEGTARVDVYSAGGLLAIAPLIRMLTQDTSADVAAFVFKGTSEDDSNEILGSTRGGNVHLVEIPYSNFEEWLGEAVPVEVFNSYFYVTNSEKLVRRYARHATLEDLERATPTFAKVLTAMGAKLRLLQKVF